MRKIILQVLMFTVALTLLHNRVQADSFVAMRDGNVRSGPGKDFDIADKMTKWVLVEDITKSGNWICFETTLSEESTTTKGAYCGNEPNLTEGSKYTFTEVVDGEHKNAQGILISSTGNVIKLWDGMVECREVIYRPLKSGKKCVSESLGVTSSLPKYELLWRIELLKEKNWSEQINKDCLKMVIKKGWTQEMVRISLGEPETINTTSIRGSYQEQWAYYNSSTLLYFEKGILTAWQSRRRGGRY